MGRDERAPEGAHGLRGRCVLIVEDEYLLADDLTMGLAEAGISIVGPVPSLLEARAMLRDRRIDGAVLDINPEGESVYPLADALVERGVPIVFVTGYDRDTVPTRFGDVPFCQKPVEVAKVIEALASVLAR